MKLISLRRHWRTITSVFSALFVGVLVVGAFAVTHNVAAASPASSSLPTRQLGSDPYTNANTQHKTQVEPSSYAVGSTIVVSYQAGRAFTAGSSNIGWATSTDKGKTWKTGFLTGLTVNAGGTYPTASNAVVAYDAAHKTWLIASLGIPANDEFDVWVNRSTDGGLTWDAATPVAYSGADSFDKDWITCDNSASSPFYGHCYAQWDDAFASDKVLMSTSSDGGKTWSTPNGSPHQLISGIGGEPVVQPNGTVVVPLYGVDLATGVAGIYSFTSTDGGKSWTDPAVIATTVAHFQTASLRGGLLPSATIDGAGKVYVTWTDCGFATNCSTDDIVLSTSSNGTTWTPVQRIPIDPVNSIVDHFMPAISADLATSGATAHLALTFYEFANAVCFTYNCQLEIGFVSSVNGGASWSTKTRVGKSMLLPWLADTTAGFMTGDYIATSIVGDNAFAFFADATPPSGGHLNEGIYTNYADALKVTGGSLTSQGELRVAAPAHVTHKVPTLPATMPPTG